MTLLLHHLEEGDVREAMIGSWIEEQNTFSNGEARQCYGSLLTDDGWSRFEEVMPEALVRYDDDWLQDEMLDPSFFVARLARRTRSGAPGSMRVNLNWAVSTLCVNEFSTAYVRGLARALTARGEQVCRVYRAGAAAEPRAECSAWEGLEVSLADVLAGHRARYWPPPGRSVFSVPAGVGCHHSIHAVGKVGDES